MLALARCGDHAEAAAIAEALVATPPKDEHLYVVAACGYALAAAQPPAVDAYLVQRYKTAALDCLRKAKERGWADVASLEKDTDLEPIRNDPAFQALLREFPRPEKNGRERGRPHRARSLRCVLFPWPCQTRKSGRQAR